MKTTAWPLALALALGLAPLAHAADPIGYVASDGVNTVPVTAATPLPVAASGASSADASGSISVGGVYQTVFAANAGRKGCLIQNPTTATETLNVRFDHATVVNVQPGGSFNCWTGSVLITDLVEAEAATTGHAFSAASQ